MPVFTANRTTIKAKAVSPNIRRRRRRRRGRESKHDESKISTKESKKEEKEGSGNSFVIVSYNVLAQSKVNAPTYPYCVPSALRWQNRSEKLLEEIVGFEANVLCLQELDNYENYWRPKLQSYGYDSVYQKRKHRSNKDGVAIFYKRDQFQLFSTQELDFDTVGTYLGEENSSARMEKGNCGLILGLQPWEESLYPSAICFATAQLTHDEEIRKKQVLMLLKSIEMFNADFQLPVILCGSFNFLPHSDEYRLVMEGRFPPKPALPDAPVLRPVAVPISQTQIRVAWSEPDSVGDAPINGYIVQRRAGGNTIAGFGNPKFFPGNEVLEAVICGLSSGTTYEFIVAAVSAVGEGTFSAPSKPVSTNKNIANPAPNRYLKHPTESAGVAFKTNASSGWVRKGSTGTPRYEDNTPNFEVSPTKTGRGTGGRNKNHVHSLVFSSAYGRYTDDGDEPQATLLTEKKKGCVDYIFYSSECLKAVDLMTLPNMALKDLKDVDPRRPKEILDGQDYKPMNWDARRRVVEADYTQGIEVELDNPNYMGDWKPRFVANENREHCWLPNSTLASDHFALRATFEFNKSALTSNWR